MPRFDGSYPNLGVQRHPDSLERQVVPQVECVFAEMGITGEISADPSPTSTGTRGLDPSNFIDLSGPIPGTTPIYCDGTFAYPYSDSLPAYFTFDDLSIKKSGSGQSITFVPPQTGTWEVSIFLTTFTQDGILAKISSDGVLEILSLAGGVETLLESSAAPIISESTLEFYWDGNSGFRASCGGYTVSTIGILVGTWIVTRFQNCKIRSLVSGVTKGRSGFEVTATDRDAVYGGIITYDDEYPWPSIGSVPVSGETTSELTLALSELKDQQMVPVLTLGFAPPEYTIGATPGGAPDLTIVDAWTEVLSTYPDINDFIVWKENYGMMCGIDPGSSYYDATPGCSLGDWDYTRYAALFQSVDTAFRSERSTVRLYGPNSHLAARGEGYDTDYGGVLVDSRDMEFLESFIVSIDAATPLFTADGIAVSGDFSDAEWPLLIAHIRSLTGDRPLIITTPTDQTWASQAVADDYLVTMNDTLDSGDVAFTTLSGWFFNSPRLRFTEYDWSFTGILTVPSPMMGAELKVASITDKILLNGAVIIQNDNATPYYLTGSLPVGNGRLALGDLEEGTYSISIFGDKGVSGTASLRVGIYSDNFDVLTLADSKYIGST